MEVGNQSLISKILAKEDVTVICGNYATASFDTENRVLSLPTWSSEHKSVSDLLISHEVGHALFTPNEFMVRYRRDYSHIRFSIFNVVEDIRIEKLIQQQYLGLRRVYEDGYKQMLEDKFFGRKDFTHSKFLDRLNVQMKCRFLQIQFSAEEMQYVKLADACITFEDVISASVAIYEYLKLTAAKKAEADKPESSEDSEDESAAVSTPAPLPAEADKPESSEDSEDESAAVSTPAPLPAEADPFESDVQNSIDKMIASKAQNDFCTHYTIPKESEIRKNILSHSTALKARSFQTSAESRAEYKKFIKNVADSVDVIYKRFYLKKSVARAAKTVQARSGSIDCSKLWKHDLDDDIFLMTETVFDDKNHGLILLVDYSGSMSRTLPHVLEHALELALFCKKASIPFEVYGFNCSDYKITANYLPLCGKIFCILSHKMKKQEFELACQYVHETVISDIYISQSKLECLSTTPLNESLFVLSTVISDMKALIPDGKVNVMVLTDGDSNGVTSSERSTVFHHGAERTVKTGGSKVTAAIVYHLRKKHRCNFINLHIIDKMMASVVSKRCHENTTIADKLDNTIQVDSSQLIKELKAEGFLHLKNFWGFNEMIFVKNADELTIDEDAYEIDDDDSLTQMRNKFVKYAVDKKTKHSILNIFADAIS